MGEQLRRAGFSASDLRPGLPHAALSWVATHSLCLPKCAPFPGTLEDPPLSFFTFLTTF